MTSSTDDATSPPFAETAARLAKGQHGIVTRQQLLAAGIPSANIGRRVGSGWLRRIHRGVYLVGAVPPPLAPEMAACLACGPHACVSHSSAARLWRLVPARAKRKEPVHVTVPGSARRRPGIRVHRVVELAGDETTRLQGIPITTPERTLLDVAGLMSSRALEQALAEAYARHLATAESVGALIERHPRRPGARHLLDLLGGSDPAHTRSHAEDRFLALIEKAGVERPGVNVRVAGHLVDFFWRRAGLVVEIDGFGPHSSRKAFNRDRTRDADLVGAGYRVLRIPWDSLVDEPEAVLVRLGKAMSAAPR